MRTVVAEVLLLAFWAAFPFRAAAQDSPHGEVSIPCEACHTSDSWKVLRSPMGFDHASTGFPLAGRHAALSCRSCHATLKFRDATARCQACHEDVHRGELGATCERCHSPKSWLVPDMPERHSQTRFPLLGAHRATSCRDCHVNQERNQYLGVPTDCYSCHRQQYEATLAPAHIPAGIGTDCVACHSVDALRWGGNFSHAATGFPLTGAHAAVPCAGCHRGNRFKGTPTECIQCHQGDFSGTTDPAHAGGGFSTACTTCHTTTAWHPAAFDHSTTPFALTGAHVAVSCVACHTANRFKGTPSVCVQCHQGDYNASTSPAHAPAGFPTECIACHTTAAWRPSSFNHSATAFALTGAHAAVACNLCHKNNVFKGTPTDCYQCHQGNFTATTNPAHVAAGFPTTCATCHTTTAWSPSSFNHSTTAFPLTGAHVAVACNQCHVNNVFKGTPTDCNQCHQGNFTATTNPAHVAAGFPTTCATCHTTTAWTPATFDHSATGFSLTGAHVSVACNQCHANNVFKGTPTQCYSCHQQDFTAAVNPPHVSEGFPTDCQTCHSTTAWSPSTFQHDGYFPISAGSNHPPGRWTTCADCHNVAGNFLAFACTNCHAHIQSLMDPKHAGVPNYQFNSQACYTCHPRGNS